MTQELPRIGGIRWAQEVTQLGTFQMGRARDRERKRRPTLAEYLPVVWQLARDWKNGYGGFKIKDLINFEEAGPYSAEHWPLSAEAIFRGFGIPEDKQDPKTNYVLTLRALSHKWFEDDALTYLMFAAPEQYRAVTRMFNPDLAGDRDYDFTLGRAKAGNLEAKQAVILVNMGIELMAMRALAKEVEIVAEFARARTALEERQTEAANKAIYARYNDLREGGLSPKDAKKVIAEQEGNISQRTVERILSSQRELAGEPKRSKGRPRKNRFERESDAS